jgi:hypothetical protein
MSEGLCMCGHVEDEHGSDPQYPGSTACNVTGCECVAYDHDRELTEDATDED